MQIACCRFFFAFLAVAVVAAILRPRLHNVPWRLHVQRSIFGWLGVSCLFAAAIQIPLADANADQVIDGLLDGEELWLDDGAGHGAARGDDRGEVASTGAWTTGSACLLALVAVALLTRHLVDTGALDPWAERIGATLVLLLGGALLRVTTRRDGD